MLSAIHRNVLNTLNGYNGMQTLRCMATSASAGGLFSIAELQKPNDFLAMLQDTFSRCRQLLQDIEQQHPGPHIVRLMDDMSDELCRTYDAAECCRQVHSDPKWRKAADTVCQTLAAYIAEVNHHEGMYRKLKATMQTYDAMHRTSAASAAGWTDEAALAGRKLLLDFEKAGIQLPDKQQRDHLQKLINLRHHFPLAFNQGLTDPRLVGSITLQPEEVPSSCSRQTQADGTLVVPLDTGNLSHFLSTVPEEAARRKVYMAGYSGPQHNLQLLRHMLATSSSIAQLLGYPSFAHYKAAGATLAATPDAVVPFLQQLAQQVKPLADANIKMLAGMKAAHHAPATATQLQPWDVDYYTARARAQLATVPRHQLQPYLYLDSCLRHLSELLQRVMGVALVEKQLAQGEAWAPGIRKFEVVCDEQGTLGTLFLDLCSRPGKYPGSVLFPIRCGRALPSGRYQQPILALVADFGSTTGGMQLTLRSLRTLLHEMGHAVHSMCSRSSFQHLWGTRCAQDLVEVPSHLLEHLALDPRTLQCVARHHRSGEALPLQLCRQVTEDSRVLAPLDLQHQVLLAMVDLAYYGPAAGEEDTSAVWARLASQYSSVGHAAGSHPEARFSHLTVYSASYYSYIYARCLSAAVWREYLSKDPFDGQAGRELRRRLLQPGGAKEPLELMSDVLGSGNGLQQVNGGWAPQLEGLLPAYLEHGF